MKSKFIGPVAILAIVVVLIVAVGAGQYNSLVNAEEDVNKSWSQVENVLQRRNDLIPNLVETVKGFAAQEREVFTAVAEARSKLLAARGPEETGQANTQMTSALGRLLAISEKYPDLKSNQNFLNLQDELAGTENRIAVERRAYNDAAAEYNKSRRKFPKSIFAGVFGFEEKKYFQADAAAKSVPKVDFNATK
jgi:LemA protein